jgi:putative nucleotidyltransferase with HDIG domain
MLPSMEPLADARILLAGDDRDALAALRGWLAAAGASPATSSARPDDVAASAAEDPPVLVLVLGADADAEAVRGRLDPLRLEAGPPVVPLGDVLAPGEAPGPAPARRLGALVERGALRARQSELESVIAGHALTRRRDVGLAQRDALNRLLFAAEYRDDNTHEHTQRVGELAAGLAHELGLGDRMVGLVRQAAPLHDIGKIAIPDSILLKPGRLTEEEFEVVKTHAVLGARVLAGSDSEVAQVAERIARSHHERWDGGGYPDGLRGEDIPVEARIVALADVFDVLVHERPYKDSWTVEAAVEEIRGGAGTQFAPEVVRAFEGLGPSAWHALPASSPA